MKMCRTTGMTVAMPCERYAQCGVVSLYRITVSNCLSTSMNQ